MRDTGYKHSARMKTLICLPAIGRMVFPFNEFSDKPSREVLDKTTTTITAAKILLHFIHEARIYYNILSQQRQS